MISRTNEIRLALRAGFLSTFAVLLLGGCAVSMGTGGSSGGGMPGGSSGGGMPGGSS
ncbi:MAG: hypothetical protein HOM16_12785, partial [Woeseia sp.]|nr:hypothetical protein [Woeseia sp.]